MAQPSITPDAGAQSEWCPIRPGEPCRLCHPGSRGPGSCGLVYLVMADPDLREELLRLWEEQG